MRPEARKIVKGVEQFYATYLGDFEPNPNDILPTAARYIERVEAEVERLREAVTKIQAFTRNDPDTTSTRFVLHVCRRALEGEDG